MYLTITLGRPLIRLNYDQLDKEANLIDPHSSPGARRSPETGAPRGQVRGAAAATFEELTGNLRRIFVVNRNLGFFTTGYNWLIQIIPALIVAPSFIAGEVEFGVITQSAMAFSMLLGAF